MTDDRKELDLSLESAVHAEMMKEIRRVARKHGADWIDDSDKEWEIEKLAYQVANRLFAFTDGA